MRILPSALAALVFCASPVWAQSVPEVVRSSTTPYLSVDDRQIYRRAFDAAAKADWQTAQALAFQGKDATARRLIQWRYLLDQNSGAGFVEIDAFLKSNPDWPSRNVLLSRAEQAMGSDMPPAAVIAWYAGRTPNTGIGKIRLGTALIESRRTSEGQEMIKSAWTGNSLQADHEDYVLATYGALLTPALHAQRLEGLIWRDDLSGARRQLARAPEDARRVAEARMALRQSPAKGLRLARQLPGSLAADPGLQFDLARVHRQRDNTETAASLLQQVARVENKLYPEKMWSELNITARQAVGEGKYRIAYRLVSNTGLSDGGAFADAEFFAGWIALTFLKEPRTALGHFQKLASGVSRPISLSRAYYWSGRALEASGERAAALEQYRKGARYGDTFYGQLALNRADATPSLRLVDSTPPLTGRTRVLENTEMTRAIRVLADLGEEPLLRVFANAYVGSEPDAARAAQLAQTMMELGYPEVAVRVAKQAGYGSVLLLNYAYPVIAVPAYRGMGDAPETPLVLGLIRQETEFDPNAVSRAGAMGIMQLMPATARRMARDAGLAYDQNKLLYDVPYNMQLGMGELQKQLDNWGGSYILATAAYNAGPGNVRKWIAKFGDPRDGTMDPVDWIESIPFGETRNYVQRVLENVQVYRNRLAGADQPSRILADLYRPAAPRMTAVTAPGRPGAAALAEDVPLPRQKPR